MMELIEQGFPNIVCTQPFGCLPNHICGKGMIGKIRSIHKDVEVNQGLWDIAERIAAIKAPLAVAA